MKVSFETPYEYHQCLMLKCFFVSVFQNIYSYSTVNSIFVEIQLDSTNIKNDPRILRIIITKSSLFIPIIDF